MLSQLKCIYAYSLLLLLLSIFVLYYCNYYMTNSYFLFLNSENEVS
jgi:hypothetical protein